MEKTFKKSVHFLEQFFPFLGPLEWFFGDNLFTRKNDGFYFYNNFVFLPFFDLIFKKKSKTPIALYLAKILPLLSKYMSDYTL